MKKNTAYSTDDSNDNNDKKNKTDKFNSKQDKKNVHSVQLKKEIQMFSSTKMTFKKSLTRNATNSIDNSNNFDNIDMRDKIDQFIILNDKENSKKSLIEINFDVKQNISKIEDEMNSKNKKFMNLISRIMMKHLHEKKIDCARFFFHDFQDHDLNSRIKIKKCNARFY